jgi:hypothetical protein
MKLEVSNFGPFMLDIGVMRVCVFGANGHVSSCLGGLFEKIKNI